jgi:hypothetical protein
VSLSQPRRQWETADDGFTEPGGTRGSEVIERLLEDRHLEEVPADADTVDRLIATARRHIASATTSAESDPEGALALAYDASRNSATALLGHQGLRPTSAGRAHRRRRRHQRAVPRRRRAQVDRSAPPTAEPTRPSIPTHGTTTRSRKTRWTTPSPPPPLAPPPPRSSSPHRSSACSADPVCVLGGPSTGRHAVGQGRCAETVTSGCRR